LIKFQIDPNDSTLPQNICQDCLIQIETACAVKLKCIETDKYLRQEIQKNQNKEIDVKVTAENFDVINSPTEEFLESLQDEISDDIVVKKKKRRQNCSREKLELRSNKKPTKDDYKCFICEQVFDLISAKDLHVKQDHLDVKVCKLCNKRKQTAIALEAHLRYHFVGYRFLCSCCGKSFRFKNLLENHLRVEHLNAVRFVCDICQYSTKFKINLERHVKVRHDSHNEYV
jgi:hypothetical protein